LEITKKNCSELTEKVEKVVNFDILTGAYNKRYFYDVAESIISLNKRDKTSLSLAMLSIDQFSKLAIISDSENKILQIIVQEVSQNIRECDILVRLDYAKFVILFPKTNLEQALVVSDKLRKTVAVCKTINDIKVTATMGVSEFINETDNINSVLKRADELINVASNKQGNIVLS